MIGYDGLRGSAGQELPAEQLWPCVVLPERCCFLEHIRSGPSAWKVSDHDKLAAPNAYRKISDNDFDDLTVIYGLSDTVCRCTKTFSTRPTADEWLSSPNLKRILPSPKTKQRSCPTPTTASIPTAACER